MMRFSLTVILFFLFSCEVFSQVITINIVDFGAKPNDTASDQRAFNAASHYINKRGGNVKLIIPAGNYLVGPEYDYKAEYKKIPLARVWDVLAITNCRNITIEGRGNATIRFLDNIPFGCVPFLSNNADSSVHIGSLFRFINSSFIVINNINANGNSQKFRLLNNWGVGANPYEREHEGLFILNCKNVLVQNCSFNYFGRDGAMFLEDQDKMPTLGLKFINCKFNYNGRNGVSWCGGEDVSFNNCFFSFNASGKIITNPATGLDIEPERGASCKKGRFTNCVMENNGGYGQVSMYQQSSDVVFSKCRIIGNKNYSFISQSPGFIYQKCTIAGTAIVSYNGENNREGTKLIDCTFVDSILNTKVFRNNYMLAVKGRFIQFSGCTFRSYVVPSVYTEIVKKAGLRHDENTFFKSCVFIAKFKRASTWDKLALLVSNSKFRNCKFESDGFADFKSILNLQEKNIDIDFSSSIK